MSCLVSIKPCYCGHLIKHFPCQGVARRSIIVADTSSTFAFDDSKTKPLGHNCKRPSLTIPAPQHTCTHILLNLFLFSRPPPACPEAPKKEWEVVLPTTLFLFRLPPSQTMLTLIQLLCHDPAPLLPITPHHPQRPNLFPTISPPPSTYSTPSTPYTTSTHPLTDPKHRAPAPPPPHLTPCHILMCCQAVEVSLQAHPPLRHKGRGVTSTLYGITVRTSGKEAAAPATEDSWMQIHIITEQP